MPDAAIMHASMMIIFVVAAVIVGAAKKTFWGLCFIALVAGAVVLWGIALMPNAVQVVAHFIGIS